MLPVELQVSPGRFRLNALDVLKVDQEPQLPVFLKQFFICGRMMS
jgi:hypothetical protein